MYFRSAPLQNTPPEPRMITQRTLSSRASCSPALRKSWAVATSIELNRSRRSIVMIPTAPSLVMSIGGIGQPPPAAARAAEWVDFLKMDIEGAEWEVLIECD